MLQADKLLGSVKKGDLTCVRALLSAGVDVNLAVEEVSVSELSLSGVVVVYADRNLTKMPLHRMERAQS